jgi:hypothetical protein
MTQALYAHMNNKTLKKKKKRKENSAFYNRVGYRVICQIITL